MKKENGIPVISFMNIDKKSQVIIGKPNPVPRWPHWDDRLHLPDPHTHNAQAHTHIHTRHFSSDHESDIWSFVIQNNGGQVQGAKGRKQN